MRFSVTGFCGMSLLFVSVVSVEVPTFRARCHFLDTRRRDTYPLAYPRSNASTSSTPKRAPRSTAPRTTSGSFSDTGFADLGAYGSEISTPNLFRHQRDLQGVYAQVRSVGPIST